MAIQRCPSVLPSVAADVLVVDDYEFVRNSLVRVLTAGGWSVETAESASGALELLRGRAYGCVISDHRMEGGNGLTLLERWAEILDPETPVAIYSADHPTELQCYERLGVRVLRKGGPLEDVRTWVRQVWQGRQG